MKEQSWREMPELLDLHPVDMFLVWAVRTWNYQRVAENSVEELLETGCEQVGIQDLPVALSALMELIVSKSGNAVWPVCMGYRRLIDEERKLLSALSLTRSQRFTEVRDLLKEWLGVKNVSKALSLLKTISRIVENFKRLRNSGYQYHSQVRRTQESVHCTIH